jgi:hypothetical protein
MKIALAVLLLTLAGCATNGPAPRPFTGPSGAEAFAVGCNEMVSCYEKIGAACGGKKYSIVAITTNDASFRHGTEIAFVFYHTIAVECAK